jgi:hypothetical protein
MMAHNENSLRLILERDTVKWFPLSSSKPRIGTPVIYCTPDHQALGYLDADDSWRFSDGTPERGPVLFWTPVWPPQKNSDAGIAAETELKPL